MEIGGYGPIFDFPDDSLRAKSALLPSKGKEDRKTLARRLERQLFRRQSVGKCTPGSARRIPCGNPSEPAPE
jgi:hypothetical protein